MPRGRAAQPTQSARPLTTEIKHDKRPPWQAKNEVAKFALQAFAKTGALAAKQGLLVDGNDITCANDDRTLKSCRCGVKDPHTSVLRLVL